MYGVIKNLKKKTNNKCKMIADLSCYKLCLTIHYPPLPFFHIFYFHDSLGMKIVINYFFVLYSLL